MTTLAIGMIAVSREARPVDALMAVLFLVDVVFGVFLSWAWHASSDDQFE